MGLMVCGSVVVVVVDVVVSYDGGGPCGALP